MIDDVLESSLFSKIEIKFINICRLYFQGTILSDITNLSGGWLIKGIISGNKYYYFLVSKLHLIQQKYPSSKI